MKILIVKTSALGDIIHAFPVLSFIKAKFPACTIDWVVEQPHAPLLRSHPDIANVLSIDSKKWRKHLSWQTFQEMRDFKKQLQKTQYDAIFDLQGNTKSGLVSWLTKSAHKVGFSKSRVPEWPNLLATNIRFCPPPGGNMRNDYLYLIQAYFKDFTPFIYPGIKLKLDNEEQEEFNKQLQILEHLKNKSHSPLIMVCPGSNWKNKQLSEEALYNLLKVLIEKQSARLLFIWGTESERLYAESLAKQLSGLVMDKMSLPVLQQVMENVSLVIAMDSLALHLAATTQTPTFSIFGASSAAKYKPTGKQHLAIQGNCPYGQEFETRCPKLRSCATGACIKALHGSQLIDLMLSHLKTIQLDRRENTY